MSIESHHRIQSQRNVPKFRQNPEISGMLRWRRENHRRWWKQQNWSISIFWRSRWVKIQVHSRQLDHHRIIGGRRNDWRNCYSWNWAKCTEMLHLWSHFAIKEGKVPSFRLTTLQRRVQMFHMQSSSQSNRQRTRQSFDAARISWSSVARMSTLH